MSFGDDVSQAQLKAITELARAAFSGDHAIVLISKDSRTMTMTAINDGNVAAAAHQLASAANLFVQEVTGGKCWLQMVTPDGPLDYKAKADTVSVEVGERGGKLDG